MRLSLFLWFLTICGAALATTFSPVSIETQIKHANAVVVGTYQGSEFKKNSDGEVITEHEIKVQMQAGIPSSQGVNFHSFKFFTLGGEWQGVTKRIIGNPEFTPGEKIALVLEKRDRGYTVQNFKMSKYSFKKKDGEYFLISSLFSNRYNYGSIRASEFQELVQSYFSQGLSNIDSGEASLVKLAKTSQEEPLLTERNIRKRSIAASKAGDGDNDPVYFLVFLFAALGVFSIFKMGNEEN